MSAEEFQTEMKSYYVLNYLINELKHLKMDEMQNISGGQKEKIEMAVAQVHVNELVKLDPKYGPLGIENKPIVLSYTEKAAVKDQLPRQVAKSIEKSLEFSNKFNEKILNPRMLTEKVVELEQNRQQLQNNLEKGKLEAMDKMKQCAEMKFSARQENVAKLLEEKASVQEIKALITKNLVIKSITGQTKHAPQALKSMDKVLETLIEEKKNTSAALKQ